MRSIFCITEFYVIRCFDVSCTVTSLSEILLTFTVGALVTDLIEFSSEDPEVK
jgi:hypothetical protein